MPEPLSNEYLKQTQQIVAAVPNGPWDAVTNDYGLPDAVGPISYLETASGHDQVPVIRFISHAREALPRYVGEVCRQQDLIKELTRRIHALENSKGGAGHGR
ncbi:hypothetical protein ACYF6T_38870 [Streptomyces sp. 7R007]